MAVCKGELNKGNVGGNDDRTSDDTPPFGAKQLQDSFISAQKIHYRIY